MMNNSFKKTLLTCIFFCASLLGYAQNAVEDINNALRQGNASKLSHYFDNNITLNISGNVNTYSKSQAEMVLKDFFSKNDAKDFQQEHDGNSVNTRFVIGTLSTSSGKYRIYYALRTKDNKSILIEIRFD